MDSKSFSDNADLAIVFIYSNFTPDDVLEAWLDVIEKIDSKKIATVNINSDATVMEKLTHEASKNIILKWAMMMRPPYVLIFRDKLIGVYIGRIDAVEIEKLITHLPGGLQEEL